MLRKIYYALTLLFLCSALFPMGTIAQELPIKNFHAVDSLLYRSAQPRAKGFKALEEANINTVISFRRFGKDKPKVSKHSKLELVNIPIKTSKMSEDDLVEIIKAIASAQTKGKVLIHCWHGADRTGTVVALYRIIYHGWSKEDALNEMMNGGYNYHSQFDNLPKLIRELDIEQFKRKIG